MNPRLYLCVLLLLASCAGQKPDTASPVPPKPAFRALGESVTIESIHNDEAIGFEVRRRLELIGAAETAGIVVHIEDGVVTLTGAAPTAVAAWRAEAAAWAVKNVRQVVNRVVTLDGRR